MNAESEVERVPGVRRTGVQVPSSAQASWVNSGKILFALGAPHSGTEGRRAVRSWMLSPEQMPSTHPHQVPGSFPYSRSPTHVPLTAWAVPKVGPGVGEGQSLLGPFCLRLPSGPTTPAGTKLEVPIFAEPRVLCCPRAELPHPLTHAALGAECECAGPSKTV